MTFIDTHTHLDGEDFDSDRDEVIAHAKAAGVGKVLIPAIDLPSVSRVLSMCKRYDGYAYPMIGLHPEEVKEDWRNVLAAMEEYLEQKDHPFIAIGEVGLDFYWSREFESEQLEAFEEQVKWAVKYKLPLMIHCRKGQQELVKILRRYEQNLCGGVFHCFTGNAKEAAELLSFSRFALGIGGVLTFKKSHLPETLAEIPLERVVLETDSPYMAPVPMRGKRNESAFVLYVLKRMAECYGLTEEQVAEATTHNAERLFRL